MYYPYLVPRISVVGDMVAIGLHWVRADSSIYQKCVVTSDTWYRLCRGWCVYIYGCAWLNHEGSKAGAERYRFRVCFTYRRGM
jgi:hypothetical protein